MKQPNIFAYRFPKKYFKNHTINYLLSISCCN